MCRLCRFENFWELLCVCSRRVFSTSWKRPSRLRGLRTCRPSLCSLVSERFHPALLQRSAPKSGSLIYAAPAPCSLNRSTWYRDSAPSPAQLFSQNAHYPGFSRLPVSAMAPNPGHALGVHITNLIKARTDETLSDKISLLRRKQSAPDSLCEGRQPK